MGSVFCGYIVSGGSGRYVDMKKSHGKAKKYLWRIRKLQQKIDEQMIEVARLHVMATSIKALSNGDKVQSSPSNTMENTVLRIMAAEEELDKAIETMLTEKQQIVKQINSLSDDECIRILTMYFVCDMSFARIERETKGLSRRTIFRLYDKGLAEFEEKFWEFM